MQEQTFILNFEGVSKSEATLYATELQDLLLSATKEAKVELKQAAPNTQDFGASIIIGILGTPAVMILARKIGDWLPKRNAVITITTESGKMVAENLKAADAAELGEKWLDKLQAS